MYCADKLRDHRKPSAYVRDFDVCWRILLDSRSMLQHTSVYVCWSRSKRQHTSVYVSIRQHTSAYVRDLKVRVISRSRRMRRGPCVPLQKSLKKKCCVLHSQKKNSPTGNQKHFLYPPPQEKVKKNCFTSHSQKYVGSAIHIRFRIELSFSSGSSCVSIC